MSIPRLWQSQAYGWLGVAFCLAGMAGCGTGAYEDQFAQAVTRHDRARSFDVLLPEKAIAGTKVSLRLPRVFKRQLTDDSLDTEIAPNKKANVDPARVHVPLDAKGKILNPPGFQFTCESWSEAPDRTRVPFCCSVSVLSVVAGQPPSQADAIKQEVQTAFPQAGDWGSVECTTPDGATIAWRRLRVEGDQLFLRVKPGVEPALAAEPGVLELWLHDDVACRVLLCWRWPRSAEAKTNLTELARLTAGSLVIAKNESP